MRAAIIGAGLAGMAAAYDLRKAGWQVDIYEESDTVGGLAAGFQDETWDWTVDHFYHHWFASDRHILGWMEEMGLRDRVIFPQPVTAVYHNERFYALDSALALLTFPGIPFLDRIRFGAIVALFKIMPDGTVLEKFTAHEWLQKWAGKRVYEKLWKPMLEGKFGPHYRDVNMAWFWARFKARTPRLGTYKGGFQAFASDTADQLRTAGVDIRLNTRVQTIGRLPEGGLRIETAGGSEEYDTCLATTAPQLLAHMAPELPAGYLQKLLKLRSMGAVVVVLALTRQLSREGVYWHNLPKSDGFPFLSLVEHTNYVSEEHFNGDHIIYCGDYCDPEHEYFQLSEAELVDRFVSVLGKFNQDFSTDWVRKSWVFRAGYAQPIPEVNHSAAIPAIRTPIAGLWLASMSQVYPWDRGTNYAVEIGRRAAGDILEQAQS